MYRQARLLGVLDFAVPAMVGIGVWLFSRFDWDRALRITSGSGKINVQTVGAVVGATSAGALVRRLLSRARDPVASRRPRIRVAQARGWMLASVAQALIMLSCLFF